MKDGSSEHPPESSAVRTNRSRGLLVSLSPCLLVCLLVSFALLAVAIALYAWQRERPPEPPLLDRPGLDPAIAAAVANARAGVLAAPRLAAAWGRLGMVLAAHEFTVEANFCFAQAERLNPKEPRWPYYQGVALALGNPDAAAPKLRLAADLWGEAAEAPRLRLAELLLGQGHLEEAETLLRAVRRRDPANSRACLGLGRAASLRGDLEESIRYLELAQADARTRKAARLLLAENYRRQGNQAAAAEASRQAAGLPTDPPWPDPFVEEVAQLRTGRQAALERADKWLRQGRVVEAVALLERTTRDYPESDWAWYLLGKAHVLQKDWGAAEQALRKAVGLTPHSPEVQFHLGVALFGQQDHRAAAACFRKAAELKPDYGLAHYNLGRCLALEGDREGAREALRAAVRGQPNLVEARIFLAELLIQEGRSAEALMHLRQATEMAPDDPKPKRLIEQVRKQVNK